MVCHGGKRNNTPFSIAMGQKSPIGGSSVKSFQCLTHCAGNFFQYYLYDYTYHSGFQDHKYDPHKYDNYLK